jgi:hypothetical protein
MLHSGNYGSWDSKRNCLILQGKEFKGEIVGDTEKMFKMHHTKKVYYFQADSRDIANK